MDVDSDHKPSKKAPAAEEEEPKKAARKKKEGTDDEDVNDTAKGEEEVVWRICLWPCRSQTWTGM